MNDFAFHNPRSVLVILFLFVAVSFSFSPVLSNRFTNWDEPYYFDELVLITNPAGISFPEIWQRSLYFKYHPLTFLMMSAEWVLFRSNPFGYHFVSLTLHLLNGVLVFLFLSLLCSKKQVALLAGGFWMIHPIHSEAVSWFVAQKDLLSVFFYLLALISYRRGISLPSVPNVSFFWTLSFFILAIFAKATAVTLPLVLLLIDAFLSPDKSIRSRLLSKWPFFLIGLVWVLMMLRLNEQAHLFPNSLFYSLPDRLALSIVAIARSLKEILWPLGMSCFHPLPILNRVEVWGLLLATAGIFVISIRWVRTGVTLAKFGTLFFLLTSLPGLHLLVVNDSLFYERFLYLPALGVCLVGGVVVDHFWPKLPKLVGYVLLAFFFMGMGFLSFRGSQVWRNSETLWFNMLKQYPRAPLPYLQLGEYYEGMKKYVAALWCYERVIQLDPLISKAYFGRGNILTEGRRYPEALKDYQQAIMLDKTNPDAYNNRGNLLMILGRADEALADYGMALRISPRSTLGYLNRGYCYLVGGNIGLAEKDFLKVLELDPTNKIAAEELLRLDKQHSVEDRK